MDTIFTKKTGADGVERTALVDEARESLRIKLKAISDIEIRRRFVISKNLLQKYYLYPGDVPITDKGKKAAEAILRGDPERGATVTIENSTNQEAFLDLVRMLKTNGVKEVTLRFT